MSAFWPAVGVHIKRFHISTLIFLLHRDADKLQEKYVEEKKKVYIFKFWGLRLCLTCVTL